MAQPKIFVSHSHQDNEWCREFVDVIKAMGWDVWYDEKGLGGGAEWVAVIQHEVQTSDIFILALTPDAWNSRWVQEELNLALVTHKHIIPVIHKQTQAGGFLLTRQWVDVMGMPGAEAARRVVDVVGQLITPSASSVVPEAGAPLPSILPPLGPAPPPPGAMPALHLTLTSLYTHGFRGYTVDGVECVLPPLCPVPNGIFMMGSDKVHDPEAGDSETPQYPVEVAAFAIGKYHVTVAEYACFVRRGQHKPTAWKEQLAKLDHPVASVSWHDAAAYVTWLARLTGQLWRLPTEAEWEKAARWDPQAAVSRVFPWGDKFDKARCNTYESHIKSTTSIGKFPTGASPCGAEDMAGNLQEWTSSLYQPYPYIEGDGREDQKSPENRVVRGGCWLYPAGVARPTFRMSFPPENDSMTDGFRLVVAAHPAG